MNRSEALEEALKLCMGEMCIYCKAEARACGLPQCIDGCETLRIAKEALALPRRNCDVGTAEEQSIRYEKFCFEHRTMERCCQDCPIKDEPCCELAWAQMPYEAQEGGAK